MNATQAARASDGTILLGRNMALAETRRWAGLLPPDMLVEAFMVLAESRSTPSLFYLAAVLKKHAIGAGPADAASGRRQVIPFGRQTR